MQHKVGTVELNIQAARSTSCPAFASNCKLQYLPIHDRLALIRDRNKALVQVISGKTSPSQLYDVPATPSTIRKGLIKRKDRISLLQADSTLMLCSDAI